MEPRSIIRWQHRLKREHPTCTERTQSLIEQCGWKGGDSGGSAGKKRRDQQLPKRIPLTPTGLLIEGDYTNNPGLMAVRRYTATVSNLRSTTTQNPSRTNAQQRDESGGVIAEIKDNEWKHQVNR
jgi:hypothetical protein